MHRFITILFLTVATLTHALGMEEGKTAPNIDAKLLNGQPFRLAEVSGKVVIINFWATWCLPCREEMPALETYFKLHKNEGLVVLAVSMDEAEDRHSVNEVMRAFTFPAALKAETDVRGYGRIWRIPMTFVIDRRGILRKDGSVGDPKIDLPTLEQVVTPLLRTD